MSSSCFPERQYRRPASSFLVAACLASGSWLLAKDTLPDFSSLSLQELSTIKVTSVSRNQRNLSQVAAAVYVITQEEIHRSGMTNVADVLRMVPGLSVARIDGSKWGVSSRGFNGRFANKLLVLVDGRSIYSPVFSGVYWDMNMPLLDTIERIEVIRGPGAAVWGANAVAGVINIITLSARDTLGVRVTTSAGSAERGSFEVQASGRVSSNIYYRSYLAGASHEPLSTATGENARDGWSDLQAGFRLDGSRGKNDWRVEGDLFHNNRDESSILPLSTTPFSSVMRYGTLNGHSGNVALEWRRRLSETSDLRLNATYEFVDRPEMTLWKAQTGIGSIELQYHFFAGKHHEITVGGGDRSISTHVEGQGTAAFRPSIVNYHNQSTFLQDEVHLSGDRLLLTGGLKIEHDFLAGWQTQPTARVLWAPTVLHSVWASVSRAVRTPTLYEHNADLTVGSIPASPDSFGLPIVFHLNGSHDFLSEISKDYELGYRAQLSPSFSMDLTGFYTHYDNLRTASAFQPSAVLTPVPYVLDPYTMTNFARGHSEGGEATFSYHPFSSWKFAASYSYLNVYQHILSGAPDQTQLTTLNSAPAHQLKLQTYWNLNKSLQLDTHLIYGSSFVSYENLIQRSLVPDYVRVDVRLGWRVKPRWEISLVAQDIGCDRNLELTPEALSSPSYTGRGFYIKSTWAFF